jgi:hypothetical protein
MPQANQTHELWAPMNNVREPLQFMESVCRENGAVPSQAAAERQMAQSSPQITRRNASQEARSGPSAFPRAALVFFALHSSCCARMEATRTREQGRVRRNVRPPIRPRCRAGSNANARGWRLLLVSPRHLRFGTSAGPRVRNESAFHPPVGPNPSLEPTRSGKAARPPSAEYHVALVGRAALPPRSAQRKR